MIFVNCDTILYTTEVGEQKVHYINCVYRGRCKFFKVFV